MTTNEDNELILIKNISIFAQYAWMINIFRYDKFNAEQFTSFFKEFKPYIIKLDLTEIFQELIIYKEFTPLDMDDWDIEERKTGEAYRSWDAQDWLLFGFAFNAIWMKTISFMNQETFNKKAIWLYSELMKDFDYLKDSYNVKWGMIFPELSNEEFEHRIFLLKSEIEELYKNYNNYIDLSIVERPLQERNINKFCQLNFDSWIGRPPIYKLFERFENLEIVNNNKKKLKVIPERGQLLIGGKHLFLEEDLDYLMSFSDYGHKLRENEYGYFAEKLPKKNDPPEYENCSDGLDYLINLLNQKKYSPNLIIMNRDLAIFDKDLKNNIKFKSSFLEVEKSDRLLTDSYDNIPIFYFDQNKFRDKVLVCQFNLFMKMYQKRLEEWYNNILNIYIKVIEDKEIEQKLKEEPQYWLFDEKRRKISKDEAIIKLKKSIIMYVGSEIEFEVLDSNACEICLIKSLNNNQ